MFASSINHTDTKQAIIRIVADPDYLPIPNFFLYPDPTPNTSVLLVVVVNLSQFSTVDQVFHKIFSFLSKNKFLQFWILIIWFLAL